MKRTTYIMFTLIIGGVVLMASLFTLVKFTGEECDDWWKRGPECISEKVDTVYLPDVNMIDIKYLCDNEDSHERSVYVKNGMHIVMTADSSTECPYVLVPDNITCNKRVVDEEGRMELGLVFPRRYCEFNDSVSFPVTICVPASDRCYDVNCVNSASTHLIVDSLDVDRLGFQLDLNAFLYMNNCLVNDVDIAGNNYVNIYGSMINNVKVTGESYCNIIYSNGTKVGETSLYGDDVEFELDGVEDFKVYPEPYSKIKVSSVYKGTSDGEM